MEERPSGTVTFLFTDIEGSTVLLRQLRDAYGDVLATHGRLLRQAFEGAGGQEIDTQGDSFFVAFSSPKDAVHAAVAAQRFLAEKSGRKEPSSRCGWDPYRRRLARGRPLPRALGAPRSPHLLGRSRRADLDLADDLCACSRTRRRNCPRATGPRRPAAQGLRPADPDLPARRPRPPGAFPPLRTLEHTPFEGDEGRLADAARRASQGDRETGEAIRVLIADDQALVRAGFAGARGRRGPRGRRRGVRRAARRWTRCAGSGRTWS